MEVGRFTPRPIYPPGKTLQYPLDRRAVGSQSWSGRSAGDRTRAVKPVARRYNDWAIPAHLPAVYIKKIIRSRMMKWAKPLARLRETRSSYKFFVEEHCFHSIVTSPLLAQIFSSWLYSQIFWIYFLPLMWEIKFWTHTKPHVKL
jgi:hypothetical protein